MTEPISLAKLKAHLRIFHSQQDDLLQDLIIDARELIEADTWLTLVPTTKTLVRRSFPWSNAPGGPFYPYSQYPGNAYQSGTYPTSAALGVRGRGDVPLFLGTPLRSVTSVTYLDENGSNQVLNSFRLQTAHLPGSIEPAYGTLWPLTRDDPNGVTIVYEAGFDADDAEDVVAGPCPRTLKRAILLVAAEMYETGGPVEIKGRSTFDRLLEKHRIRHQGLLESL
jgi:hypothetical protein